MRFESLAVLIALTVCGALTRPSVGRSEPIPANSFAPEAANKAQDQPKPNSKPDDKPKTEFVMTPGMKITATNDVGTITITAVDELKRSYTWEGATRSVEMIRRPERWYGSLGIYYPGPGYHWKEHNGIARCVAEECQRHFDSAEEALEEIRKSNEGWNSYNGNDKPINYIVYTGNGLVVMWGKTPVRKQLNVDVWQIMIRGERPKNLPGGRNDAIIVSTTKDESLESRLVDAVRKNDLANVNELLETGVDPNTQSGGSSVIAIAASKGYTDVVRALLRKKADPDVKDDEDQTPLMLASGKAMSRS